MSGQGDDWVGGLFVIGALGFGGWWLYNHYEVRKIEPAPVAIAPPPKPVRPTGHVEILKTESGSGWYLLADTVTGPRSARVGWVSVAAGQDKTVKERNVETLYQVDCGNYAAKVLTTTGYNAKGIVTFTTDYTPAEAKATYYPPASRGGMVVTRLCGKDFDAPKQ